MVIFSSSTLHVSVIVSALACAQCASAFNEECLISQHLYNTCDQSVLLISTSAAATVATAANAVCAH
jgi:hypothetical protein